MRQLTVRHISTNKYGHRLSAYETPKMTGYIVSVTADGITSQYDFMDSLELALEYRDALGKAWEAWSPVVDQIDYELSEALWVRYTELAHHAPYEWWTLEPMVDASPYTETMVENFRRQQREGYAGDERYNGRQLVDQEPTYEGWD